MTPRLFQARVKTYIALREIGNKVEGTLNLVRGLGIDHPIIRWLAIAEVMNIAIRDQVNPHKHAENVSCTGLGMIVISLFGIDTGGWNRIGNTWCWLATSEDGKPRPSNFSAVGGEDAVWREVREEFSARFPAARLANGREGIRVGADLEANVRGLTAFEASIAEQLRKYTQAGEPVSALFYGPQGSAKTTGACSIAMHVCGSYFRMPAGETSHDMIHTLTELRPAAVIIDDIDRVNDVILLELLDALMAVGVLVIGTSNSEPDDRNGAGIDDLMDAALVRSGRFDLHYRVATLDPESHAQICREQGLESVDLGPDGVALLASDLAALGRAHRVGDLPDPPAAVANLLRRRTNNRRVLRSGTSTVMKAETWPTS